MARPYLCPRHPHPPVQAVGSNAGAARENPFVAAWYRKAYADTEWQKVPPVSRGVAGRGVYGGGRGGW